MWRAFLLCSACSFSAHGALDAEEPPIDAPVDVPPDGQLRIRAGLIAFYGFDEGTGDKIHDTSGVAPAMDVTIKNTALVSWDVGLLLMNDMPTASEIAAPPPPGGRRITDGCVLANAVTIEAWVISSQASQTGTAGGPEESARVVTLVNSNPGGRNFALGQRDTGWQGQVRTTTTDVQGNPPLRGGVVTQTFQHVALTATATVRTLYVDGVDVQTDTAHPGSFSSWDPGYRLSFGNEISLNNNWNGKLLMLAIYNRALSKIEIQFNRSLGPDSP